MGVGKSWGQGSKVHPHRLLPVTLPGAPVVCLKWLYQFPLSSAICKSFICSQPHLHLVIMSVFAFSHSGTCMVVSPCGLICTFQKTNEVEELLVTYWPFRHPLL